MDYTNDDERDNFIDDDSTFLDNDEENNDFSPADSDFDQEEAEPESEPEDVSVDSPVEVTSLNEPSNDVADIKGPEKQETPSAFRVMRFEDFIKS